MPTFKLLFIRFTIRTDHKAITFMLRTKMHNIVKTNARKIWIPKEKKSEMIMFMHVMLSHAEAEKVTKYVADNYDMSSIKESIKDIISK